jgi:hypothetical protein
MSPALPYPVGRGIDRIAWIRIDVFHSLLQMTHLLHESRHWSEMHRASRSNAENGFTGEGKPTRIESHQQITSSQRGVTT